MLYNTYFLKKKILTRVVPHQQWNYFNDSTYYTLI